MWQHEQAILAVVGGGYAWIGRMVRAAVTRPPSGRISLTDRLDRVATHPGFGLVVCMGIFALAFGITYTLATPVQRWLDTVVVDGTAAWVRQAGQAAPPWLVGLLADGIIAGVGTVLTFLPILLVFYAVLGMLEDVGYLARVACVSDRFMHPLGLGFGCNVPAVLGARVVESGRGRLRRTPSPPCESCFGPARKAPT